MLNGPSNPSLILTLFLFDVTFFKCYYMVCCASHMQSKHCVRPKNSTEIFMAYQCTDLTGTAINEMETWAKREGMHILFLAVWQIPAAKKKKKNCTSFSLLPSTFVSLQGRCRLALGAARLQQSPACASCCSKTCSNPTSLLSLHLVSHCRYRSHHFLCYLDFMNTSSGISLFCGPMLKAYLKPGA